MVRRIGAGDAKALTALYRRRQGEVYRFALRMSGSAALAEDVTQEVFLLLIRERTQVERLFDPARGPFVAYLLGIARRVTLRALDCRCEQPADEREAQAPAEQGPLAVASRNQAVAGVRRAVLALPRHYREVVVLCDLEERSYTEAAAVLGLAEGTLRSRLHRARALLAQRLRAAERTRADAARLSCIM